MGGRDDEAESPERTGRHRRCSAGLQAEAAIEASEAAEATIGKDRKGPRRRQVTLFGWFLLIQLAFITVALGSLVWISRVERRRKAGR